MSKPVRDIVVAFRLKRSEAKLLSSKGLTVGRTARAIVLRVIGKYKKPCLYCGKPRSEHKDAGVSRRWGALLRCYRAGHTTRNTFYTPIAPT